MSTNISSIDSAPISSGFAINLDLSSQDNKNKQGKNTQGAGFSLEQQDTLTLSPEAQQKVRELQQRDAEVRAHEQAHMSSGAGHVSGGPKYSYATGPDKKQYAVGGSVSIDTSPVAGDPEATIEKARAVRSAALAPSSPSAQDHSVAAAASSMEAEAQSQKAQEEQQDQERALYEGSAPTAEETRRTPYGNQADMASVAALYARNVGFAAYLENTQTQPFIPSSSAVPQNHIVHTLNDVNAQSTLFSTATIERSATASAQKVSNAYSVQAQRAAHATMLAPIGKWSMGIDIHV